MLIEIIHRTDHNVHLIFLLVIQTSYQRLRAISRRFSIYAQTFANDPPNPIVQVADRLRNIFGHEFIVHSGIESHVLIIIVLFGNSIGFIFVFSLLTVLYVIDCLFTLFLFCRNETWCINDFVHGGKRNKRKPLEIIRLDDIPLPDVIFLEIRLDH